MRYYAYGATRSGSMPTDRRYTGQREDSYTQLYHMGARWYDPALGRFIQADTIVPEPGNPQDLNRFAYVRGNPLRYTDPTGHCIRGVDTIVCLAVGGMAVGAAVGYGKQVVRNSRAGMSFGDALTTDIDPGPVVGGAFLGGALAAGGAYVATTLGVGASAGSIAGSTAATVGTAAGTMASDVVEDEVRAVEALVEAASRLNEVGFGSPEAGSLVRNITEGVTHNAISAQVSLGHHPGYLEAGIEKGYTYLNMPASVWDALGNDANRWAINKQFLDNAIARGAEFVMTTKLTRTPSYYARELEYLRAAGVLP